MSESPSPSAGQSGDASDDALDDVVIEAEIVHDDSDEYDDGVIEPALERETIHDIEDAEVVGDSGLLDPEMLAMLRDTTGEVAVGQPGGDPAAADPDPETPPAPEEPLSFPRLSARTQRFTLGEPRNVMVSTDGQRIMFLRSRGGTDPVNCLWVLDAATGVERLVADPTELLAADSASAVGDDDLPAEELARRERVRESAGGITAYAADDDATLAAFSLAGRLFVADLDSGGAHELPVAGPVFDPRPDPLGQRIAYVSAATLRVADLDGTWRVVAGEDESDSVSWGSADFVAAEEMHRTRGYWWNPDGTALAAARVDVGAILPCYIGDPADPSREPTATAYPFAGTANPDVSLHVVHLDRPSTATRVVDVEWDRQRLEYLTDVRWSPEGLLVSTQSRDQRSVEILAADAATGETTVLFTDTDSAWVELVSGVPRFSASGALIVCADRDGARRLLVDGAAVTPVDLQVRSVVAADDSGVVFIANPIDDATVAHVWRYTVDGGLEALTDEPGIHAAAAGGGTIVIRTATLDEPRTYWDTLDGIELPSHAAVPNLSLNASVSFLGVGRLATVVILPAGHDGSPLPVLVDPYGGPHALRAVRSHLAHLSSQWFADQGFAVVITDGRGTPGRGSEWERAIHLDLATGVLDDQVDALEQAAAEFDCLDLDRVAIRGWSFGGYLAALAVLLRPDRFHAAVAGAPVTEWRLYDTHYTERYLGDPGERADAYDGSSLLPLAADLERPLLLIHGLADDNVMAAHTLQLSSALLAAGRPHEVLPLVGVTHMTSQEVVAENLLLHQLDFLRRSLPSGR